MFKNKLLGIIVLLIITASSAIIITGCYQDDGDARVTIHLERNDLAFQKEVKEKRFIDRILEFFSTPAEAGGWPSGHAGDIKLTISSSFFNNNYVIPAGSTAYSVEVPSGTNVTFTITHEGTEVGWGTDDNWGGMATVDLNPGDQDLIIQMLPMTHITGISPSTGTLYVGWYTSSMSVLVTSYNVYRSVNLGGPYIKIGTSASASFTDTTGTTGVTYYYKISTNTSLGEGVMCDYVSAIFPP